MTEPTDVAVGAVPSPETKPRPRLSLVWIIPIVALLIGGWLVWKTLSEKGPTITITFTSASGLEPGKTRVKYLDVDVGSVRAVRLSDDLGQVIATVEMSKDMEHHLNEATQFWVVQPRLSAGGVSGLGTLLSGSYIGMLPGAPGGAGKRAFSALVEPPVLDFDAPGRRFTLKADRLGSIGAGSAIYFRGVDVGTVLGSELDRDRQGIEFLIFIKQEFQDLVRPRTRFWNASGVRVELAAGGVTVQTESLQSILTGGIAFDTPLEASNDPPSAEGSVFTLFPDYDAVKRAGITTRIPFLVEFDGSVRGLKVGAPVDFRGIQIGVVTDIRLLLNPRANIFKIPVVIELEPERAQVVADTTGTKPYEYIDMLVKQGLRAQLASGSLITGELLVALDFFPDAKPAEVIMSGEYPQIPTIPSDLELLSGKAQKFLDNLATLPLPQLVDELRQTVRSADQLLSVQGKKSLERLDPLLLSLTNTSNEARSALAQMDATLKSVNGMVADDSRLRYDLLRMIEELTKTARTLRALGGTIERQPESVIFGKEGKSAP
ncbi:MAG: MlaD family protein [Rhodospirillales bacterium]|jgi:paraquat-inducible protein B|nr:MlaD family protein [Rhodospirillales bacterium]